MKFEQWNGFSEGAWTNSVDVRGFIQKNYTPYTGDDSFLANATEKTKKLWNIVLDLYKKEKENGGVLDIDTKTISGIAAYAPGYIQKDLEEIVGLQTDAPLKRAIMPYGGIRIVEKSCAAYNREVDPEVEKIFHGIRKTHNDGVFDAYTPDVRAARSSHLLTGLPDGYGRGRIIGDYRRVALYGVDFLIENKKENLTYHDPDCFDETTIREREELSEQIRALEELKKMAESYGFDISKPAKNSKEAIQWLYFGYLAAIKEQNGAAMSIGRTLVTKNSFRMLHTLTTLGPAPEPNLTVLWSTRLPEGFKKYTTKMSIKTSSIQYENDDLMRRYWGDDYGIACCVSAMEIGKQMQFFGARCNLAKTLLYAINGGRDEISGKQVAPKFEPITSEYLDYNEVMEKFENMMDYVTRIYIKALNTIHYMHDKYCYEKLEMALHDTKILRTMATGIAGLSVVADSLSAIKYAKVKTIRNDDGLVIDYEVEGDFPKFGNDDDRVDRLAVDIVRIFIKKLSKHQTYRNAKTTMSILTITSNVVYGKNTGNTPDGRRSGAPFGPGANPLHGRDTHGALAALNSVAKLPYKYAEDGISYTFAITPKALGKSEDEKVTNLVTMLDGYFSQDAHHLNVNVFDRDLLLDAMDHPEKYPQLTIRVSGYAVHFTKLTREQQLDVINRTIQESI